MPKDTIYTRIVELMQEAEELNGVPNLAAYLSLMQAVAAAADRRLYRAFAKDLQAGRSPSPAELKGILAGIQKAGFAAEHVRSISIVDKYVSDSPGYAGKVASVLWGGGPETLQAWVCFNDQWEYVVQA